MSITCTVTEMESEAQHCDGWFQGEVLILHNTIYIDL